MFKIFDKTNKKGIFYLFSMATVLVFLVTMISSASATTYTISTENSTSSIHDFLKDNQSPLANGDTVIFKAGNYSDLNLNVKKSITLKTSGKVTVRTVWIHNNTKISGFIINKNFYADNSNTITKNTIKGLFIVDNYNTITKNTIKRSLQVNGANNVINANNIKGGIWSFGAKNVFKKNTVSKESQIGGGKNIVASNTFKKHVYIFDNNNKITGNKIANNYKVHTSGKKNILKNNKQSYRDLTLINIGKTSKGHVLSVKNAGTKSSVACYIKINNYEKNVYNIKVPKLKKGKSIRIIIPKRIINKLKYRYYETTYYGGYIYLDKKNKNKDADLTNNNLYVGSDEKGYRVYFSMM